MLHIVRAKDDAGMGRQAADDRQVRGEIKRFQLHHVEAFLRQNSCEFFCKSRVVEALDVIGVGRKKIQQRGKRSEATASMVGQKNVLPRA